MSFLPEFDNATIRRTPDGYFSVYDCIAATIKQKKSQHYIWKCLMTSYPEVLTKCRFFKFSGRGQREIPVTDREGLAYIISLLPKVIQHKSRRSKLSISQKLPRRDITVATEIVNHSQKNLDNLEWQETRIRGKKIRRQFTDVLQSHGVYKMGYAICTDQIYQGVFGRSAKGLRREKGLSEKDNWRDHATASELTLIGFAEDLSGRKIMKTGTQGNDQCAKTCYMVAKKISEFTNDILEM